MVPSGRRGSEEGGVGRDDDFGGDETVRMRRRRRARRSRKGMAIVIARRRWGVTADDTWKHERPEVEWGIPSKISVREGLAMRPGRLRGEGEGAEGARLAGLFIVMLHSLPLRIS